MIIELELRGAKQKSNNHLQKKEPTCTVWNLVCGMRVLTSGCQLSANNQQLFKTLQHPNLNLISHLSLLADFFQLLKKLFFIFPRNFSSRAINHLREKSIVADELHHFVQINK